MICVIGGANIDIQGFSEKSIVFNDSNPGNIQKGYGGVARNICENLSLLKSETMLISPIGDCEFSKNLIKYMNNRGSNMEHSLIIENSDLSTYLSILNEENEMILAISSMKILEKLDIDFLKTKENIIKNSSVLVIDTNLRTDVIEYLSTLNKNIVIDLVSTQKAVKAKNVIGNFNTVKPNKIEVEILTGVKITDIDSMKEAANILLNLGVKNVFITLGKDGVFYMNKEKYELIKNPDIVAKDITGAGDAFSSGLAFSLEKGYSIEKMARVALSMSIINVQNIGTCYQGLNIKLLNKTLKKYFDMEL